MRLLRRFLPAVLLVTMLPLGSAAETTLAVVVHAVVELELRGPHVTPRDQPSQRIPLQARFRHDGGETIAIRGYWDGDGRGGSSGEVFKLRFTPTRPGRWTLVSVHAPGTVLHGQREGLVLVAEDRGRPGFWLPDPQSAGGRWFRRSGGGHAYVVGNTHYDFLFRPNGRETTPALIREEIRANAEVFNKLRFCVMQPRPENADPALKPFFTADGEPTDAETEQPNPAFFHQRVDVAVLEAARHDLVADLILGGTAGDQIATTDGFLQYIAARYGAFPNVWLTIAQEWNEQISAAGMVALGERLQPWLAYPVPISTHPTAGWNPALNGRWHTHAVIQGKIGQMDAAAAAIRENYVRAGQKPVFNDENGYDPGEASTADVVEGITGSFLGGGYGTTGHRLRNKAGGYFWGHTALGERLVETHPSASHLRFLREVIDKHLPFWRLQPIGSATDGPFAASGTFPALRDGEQFYVLGSNRAETVRANLGPGKWRVTQADILAKTVRELERAATGVYAFSTPESRAVLTWFIREDADWSGPLTVDASATFAARSDEPLRIKTTTAQVDVGQEGRAYGDDLEAAGGRAPYRWTLVSGALPPGIGVVGSELSGVPSAAGRYEFVVRVTDADGARQEATLLLRIEPRPRR